MSIRERHACTNGSKKTETENVSETFARLNVLDYKGQFLTASLNSRLSQSPVNLRFLFFSLLNLEFKPTVKQLFLSLNHQRWFKLKIKSISS